MGKRARGSLVASLGARGDLLEWLGGENSRGHSARRDLGTARRNSILREAAARFPNITKAEVARILAARLGGYHDTQWRQTFLDQTARTTRTTSMPPSGTPSKAWPSPIGERQRERALSR